MDELIRFRQELHRNPELSGNERATAKRIRFFLNRYRPKELITGIAGEGMAAIYHGNEPGPTLLFRCDLDALPIHEAVRRPYSSTIPGVAHVCGHDGHMTMVTGLSRCLTENPIKRGKVILFYQPEEENGQGGRKSIARLKELGLIPDFAFAIHNLPKYPLGSVVIGEKSFAAASKGIVVKLIGRNSHAAYPEQGVNPSLAVAEIVQGLNALSESKEFSDFVLITIIHIRVGEVAFGTSPGYGEIMVTLRAFADNDMQILSQKTVDLAKNVAHNHGLTIETSLTDDFPATVSNSELKRLVEKVALEQQRKVEFMAQPNRWSEDFAHFTTACPAILFGLGVGENVPELHSPEYDFPDEALIHGVEIMDGIISDLLR
ncbi:MAG TPA: amidohydrolase [Tenuifilaceae bacterium]|nr:amidohydrolase [Tenuifilaceae bacterium]HPE19452.1 amidohydrolase [Tenuifilaceae bacterium]HPJ47038.1 amidohydrolase [Tenuifilaceae bacterium]HPQ35541.1 amidohydrolase [Tenuifilaceae bacterium]HRX69268.1 amidohydrolase [Tenuifilaceae bacterium]